MPNCAIYDLTTHSFGYSDGVETPTQAGVMAEINLQGSADNYAITAQPTPNLCVLAGSGNDSIDVSRAGAAYVDAGTGMNFITGGAGDDTFAATGGPAATTDKITGFHAGDVFTLDGAFTLNWGHHSGSNATLTATERGSAPVSITFMGVARSELMTSIGHGGSQINIMERA